MNVIFDLEVIMMWVGEIHNQTENIGKNVASGLFLYLKKRGMQKKNIALYSSIIYYVQIRFIELIYGLQFFHPGTLILQNHSCASY